MIQEKESNRLFNLFSFSFGRNFWLLEINWWKFLIYLDKCWLKKRKVEVISLKYASWWSLQQNYCPGFFRPLSSFSKNKLLISRIIGKKSFILKVWLNTKAILTINYFRKRTNMFVKEEVLYIIMGKEYLMVNGATICLLGNVWLIFLSFWAIKGTWRKECFTAKGFWVLMEVELVNQDGMKDCLNKKLKDCSSNRKFKVDIMLLRR